MSTNQWTPEQSELVECSEGGTPKLLRVAVSADAGAGKTTVLVERVKRLPKDSRILCVSFTEKSKADLEQKLSEFLFAEVYTIHGFCGRVVTEFGAFEGLTPFFRIVSADEGEEMFYRSFEKVYRRSPPSNVEHGVTRFWDLCRAALSIGPSYRLNLASEDENLRKFVADVLEDFELAKRQSRSLEYNDLEILAAKLLKRPEVIAALRIRYSHIFVDEFQDTSQTQCELVNALTGSEGGLFVVGDSKQSIYRFRGADVNVFEEFVAGLPARRRLSWNFRSHPEIIEAVNSVCAPIVNGYEPMTAARPLDKLELARDVFEILPRVARVTSETDAEGIVSVVRSLQKRGVQTSQIVLLLRRIKGNEDLFDELESHGISVAITSSSSASSNDSLGKLLNLWIWACDSSQKIRAAQVVTDFLSLPLEALDRAIEQLSTPYDRPMTCENLLTALNLKFGLAAKMGSVFYQFEAFVLRHQSEGLSAAALGRRLSSLLASGQKIEGFALVPPPANLAGSIRVLTVHSAKGLEFPVVILADVKATRARSSGLLRRGQEVFVPGRDGEGKLDWSLPEFQMAKSLEEQDAESESARLLYVAMTRAQEALYVIDRPVLEIAADTKKRTSPKKPDTSWSAWLKAGISNVWRAEVLQETSGQDLARNLHRSAALVEQIRSPLELTPPQYVRARVGVTEYGRTYLSSPIEDAFDSRPALKRRNNNDFPVLSADEGRALGVRIHWLLENEAWDELKTHAQSSKLNLEKFWAWLESVEGKSVFWPEKCKVFPEFAFEWKADDTTLTGRIDRLMVFKDEAWVIDYKVPLTSRSKEDLIETYRSQIEIYCEGVKALTKVSLVRGFILDLTASTGEIWHQVLALRL